MLKDKTRLGLSIGGVALAVMLILLLNGFLAGMNAQITEYLDNEPGTLVVAQDGVENLLGVSSRLPASALGSVKARGAAKVVPILSQFVILDLHDKKQPAYLVGYDPQIGGGPWRISAGREPRNDKEIVFDTILALTIFVNDTQITPALQAGASGYLLKDISAEAVMKAIRAADRGEPPLASVIAKNLPRQMAYSAPRLMAVVHGKQTW